VKEGIKRAKTKVKPVNVAIGFLPMRSIKTPIRGSRSIHGIDDRVAIAPISATS